ncbi:MAG: PD-(D/E)XK nuclease domain-containing protein, partial [Cyanobacteriota bacterium]
LLDDFTQNKQSNGISVDELIESLEEKNLKKFFNILNSMFGTIPNEILPKESKLDEKEAYYHTIFHLIFTLIGTSINSEVSVSKGRIDSVIETDNNIFIFEFKVGRSPRKALEQIESKYYYEAYSSSKKEITLIGVNFSIAKRNIKDWKIINL